MKPSPMSRGASWTWTALALLGVLGGCGGAPQDSDVLAEYRGGTVSLAEVEQRARQLAASPDGTPADGDWTARYRGIAESIVIERRLAPADTDIAALMAELGDAAADLRRQATLDLYLRDRLPAAFEIDDEAARSYYDAHPEVFQRPERRYVFHLYRRWGPSGDRQATLDLLSGLRQRALDGEPFMLLAREYSQSETRALDGRLGWVGHGRLPPALEKVVFSLPEGGVSEPLPTADGAVLIHVSRIIPAATFGFEDARLAIAGHLREQAFRQAAEALITAPPPAGSTVLEMEELRRRLAGDDPAAVVLEIGSLRLTVADFRDMIRNLPPQPVPFVTPLERVAELYRQQVNRELLYEQAVASQYLDQPGVQQLVDAEVRRQAQAMWLDRQLRGRMEAAVSPDELESFFRDNRHLYQSPLRIRAASLAVPVGPKPAAQLVEMERVHEALVAGQLTLDEAAARVHGQVGASEWLGPDELDVMEPKARTYVLQLGRPGYTQPFQLAGRIRILHVEQWQDPAQLAYDEVQDQVRDDYFTRHQQELYDTVRSRILDQAQFRFHPEVMQRSLSTAERAE